MHLEAPKLRYLRCGKTPYTLLYAPQRGKVKPSVEENFYSSTALICSTWDGPPSIRERTKRRMLSL